MNRRQLFPLVCGWAAMPSLALAGLDREEKPVKLGVIADLHGGLATDADARLNLFLEEMASESCDSLVQLGDFAFPNKNHQRFADQLNAAHDKVIHVIGNHEFDFGLGRKDCFKAWGLSASYYSIDVGSLRLIVLDGNEKGSPTYRGGYPAFIGSKQLEWLEKKLEESTKPVMVLSHQPLAGRSAVDNAEEVQKLLGKFKRKIVMAINGHSHLDSLVEVGGIRYLHINSASYYWVGGKERMAYYSDPLFTTIVVDPKSATVQVAAKKSSWKGKSPDEIGYFDRKNSAPRLMVTPQIRKRSLESQL